MNSSKGNPSLEDDEAPKIGDNIPEVSSNVKHNIENSKLDIQNTQENVNEVRVNDASEPNENRQLEGWFHEDDESFLKIPKEVTRKWLYPSAISIMCTIAFFVAALLPTHDVIRYPEYWYEVMYVWIFAVAPLGALWSVFQCNNIMQYPDIARPKIWIRLLLIIWFVTIVFYIGQYIVWTWHFGYYQPLPQNGIMFTLFVPAILAIFLWWYFPTDLRNDLIFRKRIKYYICYVVWTDIIVIMTLQFCMSTMEFLPSGYLWIVGIEFSVMKEFNDYILDKLVRKAAGSDDSFARGVVSLQLVVLTTSTIVQFISSEEDQNITICCLAADFAMNSFLTLKIIREERRVADDQDEERSHKMMEQMITTLIINEAMELLIPLLFMVSYTIAFYGPNAKNLGNFGIDYWQYEPIEDIWAYFNAALQMACVDTLSIVLTVVVVWKFTRINIRKEVKRVTKKFGSTAAIYLPLIMNTVRKFSLL